MEAVEGAGAPLLTVAEAVGVAGFAVGVAVEWVGDDWGAGAERGVTSLAGRAEMAGSGDCADEVGAAGEDREEDDEDEEEDREEEAEEGEDEEGGWVVWGAVSEETLALCVAGVSAFSRGED